MKREEVYEHWVPAKSIWSLWARPVLFAQMPREIPAVAPPSNSLNTSWAPDITQRVAVVIDVSADESVWLALALANRGYRPVPMYNGCTGPHEVITQGPILDALGSAATVLPREIPVDAPPAFMLDSRRHGLAGAPGAFDNRWQIFPQDFPSAKFLLGKGIQSALLIQHGRITPATDLAHVLRRWQESGISILAKDLADAAPSAAITVQEPEQYRSIWQRLSAMLGLRRAPLGGFGGVVPQPSHG